MITIDITAAFEALISLEKWVNVFGEDILNYISKIKENHSSNSFLEHFNITDDLLMKEDLSLATMHVTTNNDECMSIKQYGLRNLQDGIRLDTPLNIYLKEHGVKIDIENRQIRYKDNFYDISKWKRGFGLSKKEENENAAYRKIYEDHQNNGFFSYGNILDYGGEVKRRPEFLFTLSELFHDKSIEYDWESMDNKCYVLKYKAEMSKYIYFSFGISEYELEECENDQYQLDLLKRRWLLGSTLTVLHNNMFNHSSPEFPSYLKPDVVVPYDDIIRIYTDMEYKKEYKVVDRW